MPHTPETADLSDLLACVYDAALDPGLWPSAIEQATQFLRCMAGVLGSFDIMQRGFGWRAMWGYQPKYMETFDYYQSINPLLRPSFRLKVGEVGAIADAISRAEFHAGRVYREWARPQGIVDALQTTLERTPLAIAVLGFSRHRRHGLVDDRLRRRLSLIAPHFRRAVLIGKVIDLARIEAATFANVIDGLASAVFLIDAGGRLLHANTSGEAMLAKGDLFQIDDGVLAAPHPAVQRSLSGSFAAA